MDLFEIKIVRDPDWRALRTYALEVTNKRRPSSALGPYTHDERMVRYGGGVDKEKDFGQDSHMHVCSVLSKP